MGEVEIDILEAKDLVGNNKDGKSDPYAIVRTRFSAAQFRTEVIKETLNPVWKKGHFVLPTPRGVADTIAISVYDHEVIHKDAPIGEAEISVSRLPPDSTPQDLWLKLSEVTAGAIHVRAIYRRTPSTPDADKKKKDKKARPIEGMALVRVISAKGLASRDVGGSSDPYVKIAIHNDSGSPAEQRCETSVRKHTLDPEWVDEEFALAVRDRGAASLVIQVMDWDMLTKDDLIGKAEQIPVSSLPNVAGAKEVDLTLLKGSKPVGTLKVVMAFRACPQPDPEVAEGETRAFVAASDRLSAQAAAMASTVEASAASMPVWESFVPREDRPRPQPSSRYRVKALGSAAPSFELGLPIPAHGFADGARILCAQRNYPCKFSTTQSAADGINGAAGAAGYAGSPGSTGYRDGGAGSPGAAGGHGNPGNPGTPGEACRPSESIDLVVPPAAVVLPDGSISGPLQAASATPSGLSALLSLPPSAADDCRVLVDASGGHGGRGGNGGHGGPGGPGGHGGNGATGRHGGNSAGSCNGGPGGHGGSGGCGGGGGAGGDGADGGTGADAGSVTIRARSADLLLSMVGKSKSGKGGKGGVGGHGGAGGCGGSGGGGGCGGSAGSYTTTQYVTVHRDGHSHTETRTVRHYGHTGSHGSSGPSGPTGATGPNGSNARDGDDGHSNVVTYVLMGDDGKELFRSNNRPVVNLVSACVTDQNADGVFEPGDVIVVSKIVVRNCGELPTDESVVRLVQTDGVTPHEGEFIIVPGLAPGQIFDCGEAVLSATLHNFSPLKGPGTLNEPVDVALTIECKGHQYKRGGRIAALRCFWPARISAVRFPEQLAPGELGRLEFDVSNVSLLPVGGMLPTAPLQLILRYRSGLELVEPPSQPTTCPTSPSVMLLPLQLPRIEPGASTTISLQCRMSQGALLSDRMGFQAELLLRGSPTEYAQEEVRCSADFFTSPSMPGLDAVLVASREMTTLNAAFWRKALGGLGLNVRVWDIERYDGVTIRRGDHTPICPNPFTRDSAATGPKPLVIVYLPADVPSSLDGIGLRSSDVAEHVAEDPAQPAPNELSMVRRAARRGDGMLFVTPKPLACAAAVRAGLSGTPLSSHARVIFTQTCDGVSLLPSKLGPAADASQPKATFQLLSHVAAALSLPHKLHVLRLLSSGALPAAAWRCEGGEPLSAMDVAVLAVWLDVHADLGPDLRCERLRTLLAALQCDAARMASPPCAAVTVLYAMRRLKEQLGLLGLIREGLREAGNAITGRRQDEMTVMSRQLKGLVAQVVEDTDAAAADAKALAARHHGEAFVRMAAVTESAELRKVIH